MTPLSLAYHLSIPAPATHLVEVEMRITAAAGLPAALVAFLPVWTPGSYLVREYARNVEGLTATGRGVRKIRKNAWRVETGGAHELVVRYRVYAGELTVRTSHVDDGHAFLVGASLFLGIEGHEAAPAVVEIALPPGWSAATSLPKARASDGSPGTARFVACDFDTLVDSPIELGPYRDERFDVLGRPHRYAICPPDGLAQADVVRLVEDTRTIVQAEARLFGGDLPYPSYDLLLHLSNRARGGLEHRSCAALVAPPTHFATREGYLEVLSLVAHELFHAWNIKRIRPAGLTPYRYDGECYTRSLWWFEGGTSYYDWRVLVLAGLCTVDEYLDHLAGEIAYLDQTPGRFVHALEDASYDAWIKLYRPDENSANSSVSYYRKGEVVCAMLDLELRARSGGRGSLDAVLGALWREYGSVERPVPEDGLQLVFENVAGADLNDLFAAWVRSATEIDYAGPLTHVGLALERTQKPDAPPCSLGLRLRAEGGRTIVSSVTRDAASWRAGIDAGDELISVGGVRIEGGAADAALRGRAPGEAVDVVVARDGRTLGRRVTLDRAPPGRVKIVAQREPSPAAREAFSSWLGGQPHPAARASRSGP